MRVVDRVPRVAACAPTLGWKIESRWDSRSRRRSGRECQFVERFFYGRRRVVAALCLTDCLLRAVPRTPAVNSRSQLHDQPVDRLPVVTRRGRLLCARRAIAEERLTVAFIGGSITAGWEETWPRPVTGWLASRFPGVAITAENAAIGATGSDSACFRVDREIVLRGCDLTFVEYAVNDYDKETERRGRTREGLLRKLLAAGQDVVLVHTFRQEMYADMMAGMVPESIAEFERLAEHYGVSSVWAGLHAFNEVRSGVMKWDEWLPDGLHPGHRGTWSYAQAIIGFLCDELPGAPPEEDQEKGLPAPLFPLNWQSASVLPLTVARTQGPWVLHRVHCTNHVEQVLETHTPGATLAFDFAGRGLVLIFDYGKKSAEFRYRLDGGDWVPVVRERPEWCGDRGLVRALVLADELAHGQHSFEMEVTHGNRPECTGTECRLALIGVL
jgi:hypothetical protein